MLAGLSATEAAVQAAATKAAETARLARVTPIASSGGQIAQATATPLTGASAAALLAARGAAQMQARQRKGVAPTEAAISAEAAALLAAAERPSPIKSQIWLLGSVAALTLIGFAFQKR